jgi:hypothetical protein
VDLQIDTNTSEEHTASIFFSPEDGRCSSEMFVFTYKSTWLYNPEDSIY